jgi:hypothetical protein
MMQCGAASGDGTIFMIALKREFVFSLAGHVGLLLGLLFAGVGEIRSVPPQAMTVEIVPSTEAPQIEASHVEGTPLDSTSSGSEVSSDSAKGSATAERPRPKSAASSLQQAQGRSNPQRSASLAAAKPKTAAPAQVQPETQPQASEPLLPPSEPMVQPEPHPEDQPSAGEMFAMPLALPGGRLGGGFDAPASNPAKLPHDDIAAFRARLSSCSLLPAGFGVVDENAMIVLRISFKRDGTLASPPELLESSRSPEASVLMQTAVNALQRCQPFAELPPDKYKKWKTLELVVTPMALSGG